MSQKYGRVLIVNLGDRSSRTTEIEPEILKKYIGGAGLAAHLYSQFIKGDVPPLDPFESIYHHDRTLNWDIGYVVWTTWGCRPFAPDGFLGRSFSGRTLGTRIQADRI